MLWMRRPGASDCTLRHRVEAQGATLTPATPEMLLPPAFPPCPWPDRGLTRFKQLVEWCGKDFDGLIVFDESERTH